MCVCVFTRGRNYSTRVYWKLLYLYTYVIDRRVSGKLQKSGTVAIIISFLCRSPNSLLFVLYIYIYNTDNISTDHRLRATPQMGQVDITRVAARTCTYTRTRARTHTPTHWYRVIYTGGGGKDRDAVGSFYKQRYVKEIKNVKGIFYVSRTFVFEQPAKSFAVPITVFV